MKRGFEFVNIKTANPEGAKLPTRATGGSAAYDFYSPYSFTVAPHDICIVGTYVKAKIPKGEALLILPRSSLAIKRGLTLANSPALIDPDYYGSQDNDGHILIALYNRSDEERHIRAGERIAQGLFVHALEVDNDTTIGERTGGIGSTGR